MYRSYSDKKSIFKISSDTEATEIKILGSYYQVFEIKAVQLPDRNFIIDLINLGFSGIDELTEAEYGALISNIKKTKIPFD